MMKSAKDLDDIELNNMMTTTAAAAADENGKTNEQQASSTAAVEEWMPKYATNLELRERIVRDATRKRVGERAPNPMYAGCEDDTDSDDDDSHEIRRPINAHKRAMWVHKLREQQREHAQTFQTMCDAAVTSDDPAAAKDALVALSKLDVEIDASNYRKMNVYSSGDHGYGNDDDDNFVDGTCLCSSFENPFFSTAAIQAKLALISLEEGTDDFLSNENYQDDGCNSCNADDDKHDVLVESKPSSASASAFASPSPPSSIKYQMAHREVQRRIQKRYRTLAFAALALYLGAIVMAVTDGNDPNDFPWAFLVVFPMLVTAGIWAACHRDDQIRLLVKDLFILASGVNKHATTSTTMKKMSVGV